MFTICFNIRLTAGGPGDVRGRYFTEHLSSRKPMSWTLKALLPGGARTQRIGVVPAHAPAVNGIRLEVFPQGTLALTALLYEVPSTFQPHGKAKAGISFYFSSYLIYHFISILSVTHWNLSRCLE